MRERTNRPSAMNLLDQILLDKLESDLKIETEVLANIKTLDIPGIDPTIRGCLLIAQMISASKKESINVQIIDLLDHYN